MKKLPELLAPVGSPEALSAAIEAGADAVYLGTQSMNARMGAANFDLPAIADAVSRCHRFGMKVYVTLNTLLYDRECEEFLRTAAALARAGVDAAIVADLGGIRLLRRFLPDFELHASTQASIHSLDGARAMAALGVRRVVPARELSFADIRHLATHAPLETEIFLHGALCVSYSGQCLFSSLVGGRSGNRGECAQPCRLPYNGGYPLSLRDLSLASHIPSLIESGVSSLKIEGRMKSASYVFGVTEIYRRLLDENRAATPAEQERLRDLFSRDGFTDAYFRAKPDEPMTGTRRAEDKERTRALPQPPPPTRKIRLTGSLSVCADKPARLTLTRPDGKSATVHGEIPSPAISAPLTADGLRTRIAKMGGTDYTLDPCALTVLLEDGLNLSPAAVNALRRETLAALDALQAPPAAVAGALPCYTYLPPVQKERAAETASTAGAEKKPPADTRALRDGYTVVRPFRTALCYDPTVAMALTREAFFDRIYLPLAVYETAARHSFGIYLPPIVHDSERTEVLSLLDRAAAAGIRDALCGGIGMMDALRARGFHILGDFRLNVTNRETAAALAEMGVQDCILSPELTLPRVRDIGGGVIVYGRIPLMLTERCFTKENFGCAACGHASFTDRRGVRFPLLREHPHRTLLLNSRPTYMGDRRDALCAAAVTHEHFLFTMESEKEATRVLRDYQNGAPSAGECRRIAKD